MQLTSVEARVLGCLLEKERTTPENYPLSLHALAAACNQTTNREPVLNLGEREIEEALDSLREKKFASVIFGAGARVQKYRQVLPGIYNFTAQEYALLCVLLLRGAQTPGELRARTERMAPFASLPEMEAVLAALPKPRSRWCVCCRRARAKRNDATCNSSPVNRRTRSPVAPPIRRSRAATYGQRWKRWITR